jgi:hypothetical protein
VWLILVCFLSFSSVFCKFGGWLGSTLYIHFIRSWVEAMRHSSARREGEDEKKTGKARRSSQCRAPGLGAYVEFINRPVQLTDSASLGLAPSRVAYTASSPPRLSRPPLCLVYAGHETEKPNAPPMPTQVCGYGVY